MEVIPENQSGAIGASPLSPAMVAATEGLDLNMGSTAGFIAGCKEPARERVQPGLIEPEQEKLDGLNYGDALIHLKDRGNAMARKGWNGKGMFVYYVPPASYQAQTGVAKKFFGEGALVPYNAYLAIKNVDGTVSTWVASINDQLANDWYVVDLETLKA
jgi:hypothetical protein